MGIVQLEQERSVTDGPEHGLRAGTEEDQGEYAVARPYLHDVSGFPFSLRSVSFRGMVGEVGFVCLFVR